MQKRVEKTMQNQMRFASVLGGSLQRAPSRPRPQPPPVITIFLTTQHKNAHVPQAQEPHSRKIMKPWSL